MQPLYFSYLVHILCLMYQTITEQYTFPEFIFRNHMSHENEAILRKSISDERK